MQMRNTARRLTTGVFLATLVALQPPIVAAADRGQVHGVAQFSIPDWFKDSFLEIAEDATEAADEGRHVLLFFHLEGCPYCDKTLQENFLSGDNAPFIKANFDCIEINIRGSREVVFDENTALPEKELARAMNVQYTPAVVFVNEANRKLLRLEGYRDPKAFREALEFVKTRAYESTSFTAYRREAEAARAAAWDFRKHPAIQDAPDGIDLSQLASEPLAIVFEDSNCSTCAEVHDTLFAREDVTEALSQLKVVRLDSRSTAAITGPDGTQTTPAELASALGITWRPAVVLLDRGEVRATINNRLYSWHFNGFLSWVSGRHYESEPRVYEYIGRLADARLAAGKDVNFVD